MNTKTFLAIILAASSFCALLALDLLIFELRQYAKSYALIAISIIIIAAWFVALGALLAMP